MELTQKLNEYAQKYAETLAAKDIMQHSTHDARLMMQEKKFMEIGLEKICITFGQVIKI